MCLVICRTLVMPSFRGHFSNGHKIIKSEERVDVRELRSFLSVVSVEHMRRACKGTFHVAMQVGDLIVLLRI